jgi:hypothetical protein
LQKEKLVDKDWYSQNSFNHHFGSDGVYGKAPGLASWNWVNNSDTLVVKQNGKADVLFLVESLSDTEMSQRGGATAWKSMLFKTSPW